MAAPTASKNGSALDALDEAIVGTDSTIVYNASKSPATARWQFAPWSAVLTYVQTALGSVFQPLATVLTNTTAAFTTAQETKLSGIEAAADVTDAGNVAAAGAVMTSGALGTPASGTLTNCTGLPIAGLVASTTQALGVGSVELGHASDTSLTRSAAGVLQVEGKTVALNDIALPHTASVMELGHASDTTLSRVSAGVVAVESVRLVTTPLQVDLDVDAHGIVSLSNGNIPITPNGTGKTLVTNLEAAVPMNDQTGTTYTLVLADASKMVTMNNASANTLTIPANGTVAFPIGSMVMISQLGAGQTTVAITSDTLNVNATFQLKLAGQHSNAFIIKKTSTVWVIGGDLALA